MARGKKSMILVRWEGNNSFEYDGKEHFVCEEKLVNKNAQEGDRVSIKWTGRQWKGLLLKRQNLVKSTKEPKEKRNKPKQKEERKKLKEPKEKKDKKKRTTIEKGKILCVGSQFITASAGNKTKLNERISPLKSAKRSLFSPTKKPINDDKKCGTPRKSCTAKDVAMSSPLMRKTHGYYSSNMHSFDTPHKTEFIPRRSPRLKKNQQSSRLNHQETPSLHNQRSELDYQEASVWNHIISNSSTPVKKASKDPACVYDYITTAWNPSPHTVIQKHKSLASISPIRGQTEKMDCQNNTDLRENALHTLTNQEPINQLDHQRHASNNKEIIPGKNDLVHGHDAEGPISDLLPTTYHQYLTRDILKSYVCGNQTYADRFQRLVVPSDIPVMAFDKKKPVYRGVLNSLNERGKAALKEIRPWLVNLLVDWCNFDEIICNLERPGQSTGYSEEINNVLESKNWRILQEKGPPTLTRSLMKELFTTNELLNSSFGGKKMKCLDPERVYLIRETVMKEYQIPDFLTDTVWSLCKTSGLQMLKHLRTCQNKVNSSN